MDLGAGAQNLYRALRDYEGSHVFEEVITPWLADGRDDCRTQLEQRSVYATSSESPDRGGYWLEELYALSRVSDVLLLGFQPELAPSVDTPWAHQLHLVGTDWPAVTREQYLELFVALGMSPVTDLRFDPMFHEIIEVDQAEDPDTPITAVELVWPGLTLGQMVFARAGVKVRAGAHHAELGVADRAPLYWTFLRRHRPTVDLSHGWGHNSQWATDFRRDYSADQTHYLNVDVTGDIDADDPEDGDLTPLLTSADRRDLVRHRCLVRMPHDRRALEATDAHWATNLWPFHWSLTVRPPVVTRR